MREFKPILFLIGKFFLVYIVLTLIYSLYLNYYLEDLSVADPFTRYVAKTSSNALNFLGYNSKAVHIGKENFMRFYLDKTYASIVNEGCNAISVMIIFASFVIAFSKGFIETTIFTVVGLLLLHFINIIRVAWLNYIFVYFPEWGKASHDYAFPAIIYGSVVLLWLIWVKLFLNRNEQSN